MPRRRRPETREILPDPVYNSTLAEKFVNSMMWDGKKAVSQRIFYRRDGQDQGALRRRSFEALQEGGGELQAAAGSEDAARGRRQLSGARWRCRRTGARPLAIRWILQNARSRPEKGMPEKLANELSDAANSRGGAIKKKDDVHRMAEANKAFAHYRW